MVWLLVIYTFGNDPVMTVGSEDVGTVRILVDSGSAATICPLSHATGVPVQDARHRSLSSAGKEHNIEFYGNKKVQYQLDNGAILSINWDVGSVRFPIASVRKMNINGPRVWL